MVLNAFMKYSNENFIRKVSDQLGWGIGFSIMCSLRTYVHLKTRCIFIMKMIVAMVLGVNNPSKFHKYTNYIIINTNGVKVNDGTLSVFHIGPTGKKTCPDKSFKFKPNELPPTPYLLLFFSHSSKAALTSSID